MQRKLISLLIACAVGGMSSSAFSLDDKAVLKRLDQLEAQRKADQAEISALRNKVQQLETQKGNAISSDEAAKLREEIVKVDKKAASRTDSVKKSIESERDKLNIKGYMSVYGVKSTNKNVTLGTGVDNHIGFNSDTVAGIQFDYKLDEKLDAVVQLQAQGAEDYDLDTPWAFLRYKLTPNTTVRAGRMVLPLYLYADSIDVGYTYPWVRPPVEMYGTASPRYTGLDLIHNFNLGDWNNNVEVLFGDNDGDTTAGRVKSNYQAAAFITFNRDAWTVRAGESYSDDLGIAGVPALSAYVDSISYLSASLRYDNGSLFALAEGRRIDSGKKLEPLIPDLDGFYTTLGYQIDKFMPYVTWAKSYTTNEPVGVFQRQTQESIGLGLRYNLTNKVVLKGEATKYDHFDGTAGVSGFAELPTSAVERAAALQKLDDDGVTVMSLGVDAIF